MISNEVECWKQSNNCSWSNLLEYADCVWWLNLSHIFIFRTNPFFLVCICEKQPPEVFCKKGVLRDFAKFTRKHLCQSLFFNKVAGGASILSPSEVNFRELIPRLSRYWCQGFKGTQFQLYLIGVFVAIPNFQRH